MDVTWFGGSCIRIETSRGTLVVNPYTDVDGSSIPGVRADVVLQSTRGASVSAGMVPGDPFVVNGPGEYEVGGVFIVGATVPGPDATEGVTTAYSVAADGVTLCHLGHLSGSLAQDAVERLGRVDALVIPFGGQAGLTPGMASELVARLEPALLVPIDAGDAVDDFTARFLGEMGMERPEVEETLRILPNRLPDDPEVRLLDARS